MGIKIMRASDRVKVKIDEAVFTLRPLNLWERDEMLSLAATGQGDTEKTREATIKAIRYAVVNVEGIECLDGTPYELNFDGPHLTEECVNELLMTEISDKMVSSCYAMIYGLPQEIRDSEGNVIPGVEVIENTGYIKKKNN
jgi:hypothetical protein